MVVKLAEESGAAVPRHHSPFPARHGAHGGILFPDCKRSLVSNLLLCVRASTRARAHTHTHTHTHTYTYTYTYTHTHTYTPSSPAARVP